MNNVSYHETIEHSNSRPSLSGMGELVDHRTRRESRYRGKPERSMLTLNYMLNRAVRLYGDRPAIVDPEAGYSWAEHADRVARAASVLASLGVEPGKRFGIVARNSFRQ